MRTKISAQSRFDARLPKEQKELFERTGYLGGYRNLTDFIFSERDIQIFFDAITNPQKPSDTLRAAFKDYNSFHSN